MTLRPRTAEATLRMSPAALTYSRMIELMELAAVRLMKSHQRDGESSVSIAMRVTHAASTTVGGTLRAVAAYDGISGRLHRFKINVFDESGLIGSAEHTRAVVIERRLSVVTQRRAGNASSASMV